MTRRRRGRPRKKGQRYPSGELRPVGPTDELMSKRAAMVGRANATHEDAGWLIGALYLRGDLGQGDTARQRRDAGERLVRLVNARLRHIDAPLPPRALSMLHVPGVSHDDDPVHYARVRAEYAASVDAIAECGLRVLNATMRACRDECEAGEERYVIAGLDALHDAGEAIKRAGRQAADAAQKVA